MPDHGPLARQGPVTSVNSKDTVYYSSLMILLFKIRMKTSLSICETHSVSAGYFVLGMLTSLALAIMATLVVPSPYRDDLRALIKKAYNIAR